MRPVRWLWRWLTEPLVDRHPERDYGWVRMNREAKVAKGPSKTARKAIPRRVTRGRAGKFRRR